MDVNEDRKNVYGLSVQEVFDTFYVVSYYVGMGMGMATLLSLNSFYGVGKN